MEIKLEMNEVEYVLKALVVRPYAEVKTIVEKILSQLPKKEESKTEVKEEIENSKGKTDAK